MANLVRFELDPADKASLYKAFKDMEQGASNELKTEVKSIVGWLAADIQNAANVTNFGGSETNWGNQARVIAKTVRPRKDRLPYIQIGGSGAKTSKGTPAGILLKGNEFGANNLRRFANGGTRFPMWSGTSPTGRGSAGWWIYPTLRAKQAQLTNEWKNAIERFVINPWGRNG